MIQKCCHCLVTVYLLSCVLPLFFICPAEKIQYISTEHPKIEFVNKKYAEYFNMSSRRYGRNNPLYYVDIHFKTVKTFANNVTVDFYFLEYLSNVYKRGFIEMHFKFCDLIHKDLFFGAAMKQGKLAKPCPYPPDVYDLYNMSIDVKVIPRGFPFTKGRIMANLTATDTMEHIGHGYIDMEIKEFNIKRKPK